MKIREIQGGIRIPLSNVENDIANKIQKSKKVYKSSLNEQDAETAERMVTKGALKRGNDNDGTFFRYNGLDDIWRT